MVILKATSLFDGHLMDTYMPGRITLIRAATDIIILSVAYCLWCMYQLFMIALDEEKEEKHEEEELPVSFVAIQLSKMGTPFAVGSSSLNPNPFLTMGSRRWVR
jgi:hypothetical protein